jgi:hypothetical protein
MVPLLDFSVPPVRFDEEKEPECKRVFPDCITISYVPLEVLFEKTLSPLIETFAFSATLFSKPALPDMELDAF